MNLIFTSHLADVEGKLSDLTPRLSARSTILFRTRGLGLLEDLFEGIFRDPLKRPTCLVGYSTHALHKFRRELEPDTAESSHESLSRLAATRKLHGSFDSYDTSKPIFWDEMGEYRVRAMSNPPGKQHLSTLFHVAQRITQVCLHRHLLLCNKLVGSC